MEQIRQNSQTANEIVDPVTGSVELELALAKALFDRSACIIIVVDADARVLRINQACESITGYMNSEVAGKPFADVFVAPDQRERIQNWFESVVQSKETIQAETTIKRKDGGEALMKGSATVILNQEAQVETIIWIGLDITVERAAQQALFRSQERFELAQRSGSMRFSVG